MREVVPWQKIVVIGLRSSGEAIFRPEIAGLTLNEALDYATDPRFLGGREPCIWLDLDGQEVVFKSRKIKNLAIDPRRPALPSESFTPVTGRARGRRKPYAKVR